MFKKTAILVVVLSGIVSSGCTDARGTREVLKKNGYTNISTDGYSWFGCGEGDLWRTKFHADSPSGDRVNGIVCKGLLKGKTIRFD